MTTSIRRLSALAVMVQGLQNRATLRATLRFVRTVLVDFFWLQFSVKLRLRRIPVVNVDHPLDERIPFTPARIDSYLDFVSFWIRPIGMVRRLAGKQAEQRHAVTFIDALNRAYSEAAQVYRVTMSTTRRPRYLRGRFGFVHLFDPHYLCVPSLHVTIVVLTYLYFGRVFTELGAAQADALGGELFDGAIDITESVLLVKQHSVNCVPAALYAVHRMQPQDATLARLGEFIDGLFTNDARWIDDDAAVAVREHIRHNFVRLVEQGVDDAEWPVTVRRYLAAIG